MNADRVDELGRPPGRERAEVEFTDFTVGANPRRPPGVASVFDSALIAARERPSDDYLAYRAAAAEQLGCEASQVLPCSGEFPGMRLLFDLLVDDGETVLTQTPGCQDFPRETQLQGATSVPRSHDSLLDADPTDHEAAVLCRPNTTAGPDYETGDLLTFIERCREADTVVIVDETYLPMTGKPTLSGVEGVAVLRSLGEGYGLPGLRMGLIVATGQLRERLDTARTSWGLSVPEAAVGEHCLRQEGFLGESRERIAEERERLRARLETRFEVSAEGVFLRLETDTPEEIAANLREQGMLVADGSDHPGMENRIVITLRTPPENDRLLDAFGV
ncbi:aminotransferase class I/II-fold pyridoxal phosphate-dependent enzyme [Halolamina sp.]|uniref:aminotransferase class I/II-fold pyridoxal phosphate-dependent enzyme n=1 Tax=Halolamina sp. TaxID=1940283 RepID=UPI000223BCE5|nr:aminotransferase class I and II [halophilic archaeon DL31]